MEVERVLRALPQARPCAVPEKVGHSCLVIGQRGGGGLEASEVNLHRGNPNSQEKGLRFPCME